jgi:hypothetical protein
MGARVFMDGTDVTEITLEGSATHQHNRPSFATVRQPAWLTPGTDRSRLKILLDGSLDFHGSCVHIEDQGDEDTMYTTFTFADPTLIFEMRPARDGIGSGDRGDFSKPSFMTRNTTAPQMIQEILQQSLDGSNPADGEGPMGITLGSFATGGVNLSGAPADWPMSIAQVIALLADTGELDVVNKPIDAGGNMGEVSAYNGDYGQNLAASVRFEYQTGSFNARGCRRTLDLRDLMNKLWIYLGPRVKPKSDPQGDQHWAANISGSAGVGNPLNNPPYAAAQAAILAQRDQSQLDNYTRMAIRIFDGDESQALHLYLRWWQMESYLRLKPKTHVHVTPQRGIAPAFRTGDVISVAAGARFRGGFAGAQRVMEYTYRWNEDGVVELGEPVAMPGAPPVVTTADAEGLPS